MPAVLLVRHAQASFGGADYDVLSERGAAQAAAVHAALAARGVRPVRLVAGSLRRQRDTAIPWTGAGVPLEIDERWDEYDSADVLGVHGTVAASLERGPGGDAAPMDNRAFQAVLDDALTAWVAAGAAGPAATAWPVFRDRIAAALAAALDGLGSGETAVVITSGGAIAAACVLALGIPDDAFVTLNRVAVNGAVTKLVSGRAGTTLVSFNEHAHLEPLGLVTYR